MLYVTTKKSSIISEITLQAVEGYYSSALVLHFKRLQMPSFLSFSTQAPNPILADRLWTLSSSSPFLQNGEPRTQTH